MSIKDIAEKNELAEQYSLLQEKDKVLSSFIQKQQEIISKVKNNPNYTENVSTEEKEFIAKHEDLIAQYKNIFGGSK